MRVSLLSAMIIATLALGTGAGCTKMSKAQPKKTVPSGTAHFQFTRKAQGPIELTIDGVRVAVEPARKGKKAKHLMITGLAVGKHRFFLYSPRDAFGPDQGEFEITAAEGVHRITFVQAFDAVLYGKADALPPAEGLPGVRAYLVP